MRSLRLFSAAVLALVLCAVATVGNARPAVFEPVWPLVDGGRNICTVTNINTSKRLWLTAAHCIEGSRLPTIMGDVLVLVVVDTANDIAIVQTERVTAASVRLARKAPKVGAAVWVTGYPFGMPFQVTAVGTVAALRGVVDPMLPPFALFNITGAPGNSGSAIFNAKGEVVSVLQVGWGRSWSPMIGGVVFETLDRYREYFE